MENTENIKEETTSIVESDNVPTEPLEDKRVKRLTSELVTINDKEYKLLKNFREAFDVDMLDARYSDVLNKYDYIVGDIGFEQLRLKGFFEDYRKKVAVEHKISTLNDYLYEYCNFGCAYFVLEKVEKDKDIVEKKEAFIKEKKGKPRNPKQQMNKKNKPFKNKNQGQQQNQRNKPNNRQDNNKQHPYNMKNTKNQNQNQKQNKPKNISQEKKNQSNQVPNQRNFTIRKKEQN